MNTSGKLDAYLEARLVTEVRLSEATEPVAEALPEEAGSLWSTLATSIDKRVYHNVRSTGLRGLRGRWSLGGGLSRSGKSLGQRDTLYKKDKHMKAPHDLKIRTAAAQSA